MKWKPIESAPTDGTLILVWCASRDGLPGMYSLCRYHPNAGFCVDELRYPTYWMELPEAPLKKIDLTELEKSIKTIETIRKELKDATKAK
jgi:hypothetical protein